MGGKISIIQPHQLDHQIIACESFVIAQVFSKDLRNNTHESKEFDALFVCNGHYSAPIIPYYVGLDDFAGHKMHSKDYRRPDQYQDETVLVIGAGPSGELLVFFH